MTSEQATNLLKAAKEFLKDYKQYGGYILNEDAECPICGEALDNVHEPSCSYAELRHAVNKAEGVSCVSTCQLC
jgi:hypothetical protein